MKDMKEPQKVAKNGEMTLDYAHWVRWRMEEGASSQFRGDEIERANRIISSAKLRRNPIPPLPKPDALPKPETLYRECRCCGVKFGKNGRSKNCSAACSALSKAELDRGYRLKHKNRR